MRIATDKLPLLLNVLYEAYCHRVTGEEERKARLTKLYGDTASFRVASFKVFRTYTASSFVAICGGLFYYC